MAEGCPSHTSLCPTPLHGPSSIKPCLFPYTVLLRALFDWDIRVPSTLILQSFAPARPGLRLCTSDTQCRAWVWEDEACFQGHKTFSLIFGLAVTIHLCYLNDLKMI